MQLFNLNRTLKYALSGLWSGGPYVYNSSKEMFVFLFDGTEGVPASADDIFPNSANPSGVDNFQNYAKNCFAYGILSGQSSLSTDTDTGYRANTEYLTLKHPVIKPEMSGFLDFDGVSVVVPEHVAFTADWINCTGTGTGPNQPTIQNMNKMFALNPSLSKLSFPYLGLGFALNNTTLFSSIVFVYNEPITVDCFMLARGRQGYSGETFDRYSVQYLNESGVWITLGTTPSRSASAEGNHYDSRFLQFASVTASQFRLLRTFWNSQFAEGWQYSYFGNTNLSVPTTFEYPSVVYGLITPNIATYGKINYAGNSFLQTGSPATPASRSVVAAANTDYSGNTPVLRSMPSFLVDVTDLAGSGRIKLPTLNSDPSGYFGFNNLIVDLL
jgi:hypothetical protein